MAGRCRDEVARFLFVTAIGGDADWRAPASIFSVRPKYRANLFRICAVLVVHPELDFFRLWRETCSESVPQSTILIQVPYRFVFY